MSEDLTPSLTDPGLSKKNTCKNLRKNAPGNSQVLFVRIYDRYLCTVSDIWRMNR